MAPALFKDFIKSVTGHFDDDYESKVYVKTKHTTSNGVNFTSENVIAPDYKVTGKLVTKFKVLPTPFSVDKIQLKDNGDLTGEFSLGGLAPGLLVTLKGDSKLGAKDDKPKDDKPKDDKAKEEKAKEDKEKGAIGFEYSHPLFAASGEYAGSKSKSNVSGSAVFDVQGVKVGGEANVALGTTTSLASYSAGISHGSGPFFVAALLGKKPEAAALSYSLAGSYKCSNLFTSALLLTCDPKTKQYLYTLGGTYKYDSATTIKAKVGREADKKGVQNHRAALSIVTQLLPKTSVTVSGAIIGKSFDETKSEFGVGVTLG